MEDVIHLDTHIVIWLYLGKLDLITENVKDKLNKHDLVISPIVKLEIQYLYEIDRLLHDSNKVVTALQNEIGLKISSIDFNSIVEQAIRYNWTRDPFDRIITAQAAHKNTLLITKDESILSNYKHAYWQ